MYRRLRLPGLAGVGALVVLFALLPAIAGATIRESQHESEIEHVTITDTRFNPQQIVVGADGTVVWKNVGQQRHTVTANDGSFNSGPLTPGQTFTFTFNKVGVFAYHDAEHSAMSGKVDVQKELSEAKPAAVLAVSSAAAPLATSSASFAALTTATQPGQAAGKVQLKPARLPRTGEGEPDIIGSVLLAALLTIGGGLGLRFVLARAHG